MQDTSKWFSANNVIPPLRIHYGCSYTTVAKVTRSVVMEFLRRLNKWWVPEHMCSSTAMVLLVSHPTNKGSIRESVVGRVGRGSGGCGRTRSGGSGGLEQVWRWRWWWALWWRWWTSSTRAIVGGRPTRDVSAGSTIHSNRFVHGFSICI